MGFRNLDPTREIIEMDRGDVADMSKNLKEKKKPHTSQKPANVCLRLALYRLKRVLQVHLGVGHIISFTRIPVYFFT